jgi:signal transduction histidine kinase
MPGQSADLNLVLKKIKDSKKLPIGERDYLQDYMLLEKIIVESNLGYTKEKIREIVKAKFNTKWLSPRLYVLFNKKNPDQLIFSLIFLESVLMDMVKYKNLKELQGILRQSIFLNDIVVIGDKVSLSKSEIKLFSDESKFIDIMVGINELLHSIYSYSEKIIGASQTHNIFSRSFEALRINYEKLAKFSAMIKALPAGILDDEKFSLLSKEELESVSRKLSKIDKIKSDFTNIAAHELKTPLVPIKGYLSMMLKNPEAYGLNKEAQKFIGICLSSAERLEDLVTDILDISKLEAGEMKFDMEEIDLAPLLKNESKQLSFLAKENKTELKSKVPKTILVYGDSHRLSQAIGNLIKNAIKFAKKGSVTINASIIGSNVRVDFIDTGMGMREEDKSKLFTKFFQGQDIATRKTKGTGLGLAICKEIIEKHKGKIWAESEGLGKGSTFSFALPVKISAKETLKTKEVAEK